jgi:hypothetical protein
VDVIDIASEQGDDGLTLVVASCNGAPEADVEFVDGQYLVEVRTTQEWDTGNECADLVTITIDPDLDAFEVVDQSSNDVFPYPPVPEIVAPSVDIEGQWRMIEVNGAVVEVGVNTIEIPMFEITSRFLSGQLGCNTGGAELLIDGNQVRAFLESTAELCSNPDGSEEMIPTERVLRFMLESEDGFSVELTGDIMTWVDDSDALRFTRDS